MSCMCGASASTLLGNLIPAGTKLKIAFAASICAFGIAGSVNHSIQMSFAAFMVFEFCVGLYFPSIGELKSDIVPEQVRTTVYNFYRVPLNAIVVALLLGNLSMKTCFMM